jgi:hypothetical protein
LHGATANGDGGRFSSVGRESAPMQSARSSAFD